MHTPNFQVRGVMITLKFNKILAKYLPVQFSWLSNLARMGRKNTFGFSFPCLAFPTEEGLNPRDRYLAQSMSEALLFETSDALRLIFAFNQSELQISILLKQGTQSPYLTKRGVPETAGITKRLFRQATHCVDHSRWVQSELQIFKQGMQKA
jgi:hypothetical protein